MYFLISAAFIIIGWYVVLFFGRGIKSANERKFTKIPMIIIKAPKLSVILFFLGLLFLIFGIGLFFLAFLL